MKKLQKNYEMDRLFIQRTKDTPEVDFRWTGQFKFEGISMLIDCDIYFLPAIKYLEMFRDESKENAYFIFKFTFFHTGSTWYIRSVLEILSDIQSQGREVNIEWHYDSLDEDMKEMGEDFEEQFELNFNFIKDDSYEKERNDIRYSRINKKT